MLLNSLGSLMVIFNKSTPIPISQSYSKTSRAANSMRFKAYKRGAFFALIFGMLQSQLAYAFAETWMPITQPSQLPEEVVSMLADCEFVKSQQVEWLNGDNLARNELGDGKALWFSTCWTSASQIFSAFILEDSDGYSRVILQQFIDGKLERNLDVVAGARWAQSTKTLTSIVSAGCASNAGSRYTWKWNGDDFMLTEQAESDECIGQNNWPTVYPVQ